MNKNCYRYLLFDADNTLLDFDAAEKKALFDTMNTLGISIDETSYLKYLDINHSLWKQYEKGELDSETVQQYRFDKFASILGHSYYSGAHINELYQMNLSRQSCLIDGAHDLCRYLRDNSFCIIIVTNGVAKTQRSRIMNSTIAPYIYQVFISGEIGHQKPSQEFFQNVLDGMHDYELSRYLIIGDSLTSDIQGGKNCGIDTCWYNPKGYGTDSSIMPTYVIRKLEEVLMLL